MLRVHHRCECRQDLAAETHRSRPRRAPVPRTSPPVCRLSLRKRGFSTASCSEVIAVPAHLNRHSLSLTHTPQRASSSPTITSASTHFGALGRISVLTALSLTRSASWSCSITADETSPSSSDRPLLANYTGTRIWSSRRPSAVQQGGNNADAEFAHQGQKRLAETAALTSLLY